ncbi:LysR family transcriptional regulator [Halioglobus sp. HI00S01]|uniref:LysR family transcriptional regulator n=1 Tax=Halioglobus sp. HI00S01 TaxID=1822214 RepID=UPI0007C33022|nr:LysR family transcriptional regulator [Halioglobus sp. HI00S01]KZX60682.1 LysR family transcriptional regulator [Halioglobus sp. HI00S01]
MRLNRVDLNLFVVLDTIYTERNLTRTADVLCVTQPTVSNALARLRKTFNDELFVRTPKGMVPTPLTENIIGRVRESLQMLETSVLEGDVFDPQSCDRLFQLSMNDDTAATLLPDLMETLGREAPGISVQNYLVRRRELFSALASGQLDLAIDVIGRADPQLCHEPLFKERYVCLVRPDHPDLGDSISMEQYLAMGHVHVSSRPTGLGIVDAELNRLGYQRDIRLRMQNHYTAPEVVGRTDLLLTAPSHWARRTQLKALEMPLVLPGLQLNLIWHRSADNDQASRWIREKIMAFYQQIRG